jgi:hypothetical protein
MSELNQKMKTGLAKTYKWDYLKKEIDEIHKNDPKKNYTNAIRETIIKKLNTQEDILLIKEFLKRNQNINNLVESIDRNYREHYIKKAGL